MKVTRSDGQRKPRRGDEQIIQGIRGNNRVEVFVIDVEKTYKTIDKTKVFLILNLYDINLRRKKNPR